MKEMESIKVNAATESALNELAYTATETGIIPFKFHDCFLEIIQLVKLAERYTGKVPENLKM